MDIKKLQKNWNELGKINPLQAILDSPRKKEKGWEIDEFFKTGTQEIETLMEYVKSLGVNLSSKTAFDFGCGVGRLTQPLCQYFDEVYGVDIAPSMIELAQKYNRYGKKCRYYLNNTDDLRLFPANRVDFIYTNITLQHLDPRYSKKYIKEFLRILTPGGVLIFQLPNKPKIINEMGTINFRRLIAYVVPKSLLEIYRKAKYGSQPRMDMYWIKRKDIVKFLKKNKARIVDIKQDQSAGEEYVSFRYCVMKE